MFNQQLDNLKAVRAINVIKRIEGIPVQSGMVVPVDLTVPHLEAPTVTYKITPPPMPEYKPPPEEPPRVVPYKEPIVGYA